MLDTVTLIEFIKARTAELRLDYIAPVASSPDIPAQQPVDNWLGWYQPDARHALEIISPVNYRASLSWLEAQLQKATEADALPFALLFTDALRCPARLEHALQQASVSFFYSPQSARHIVRAIYALIESRLDSVPVHGVLLNIEGQGVLLRGPGGIGKSSLALELISRGHALVSDDIALVYTLTHSPKLFGICPPLLYDLLHVRELGVLNIARLFGAAQCLPVTEINLAIDLVPSGAALLPCTLHYPLHDERLLGQALPVIKLMQKPAQSMAVIVETAVKNQVLYAEGYDANADLRQRQQRLLEQL